MAENKPELHGKAAGRTGLPDHPGDLGRDFDKHAMEPVEKMVLWDKAKPETNGGKVLHKGQALAKKVQMFRSWGFMFYK